MTAPSSQTTGQTPETPTPDPVRALHDLLSLDRAEMRHLLDADGDTNYRHLAPSAVAR